MVPPLERFERREGAKRQGGAFVEADDGAFKVQRKEEIKVKGEEQVQVWRAGLETESKTENRQPAI